MHWMNIVLMIVMTGLLARLHEESDRMYGLCVAIFDSDRILPSIEN